MTNTRLTITKISPDGPAGVGLEDWGPFDPALLVEGGGEGLQKGYMVHEDKADGLSVGVWDASSMTGVPSPWSSDEFMIVLDGGVDIEEADGKARRFAAPDTFLIPHGCACAWIQPDTIRKIFVIRERPSTEENQAAQAGPVRIKPDHAMKGSDQIDASRFRHAPEWQRTWNAYSSADGRLHAGLWESAPFERVEVPFSRSELMHILSGRVTLFDDAGGEWEAGPGESLFVPKGAAYGWRSEEPVRKIYCIVEG